MQRVKPVRASALCEELRVQVRSDIYRIEDVVKGIAAEATRLWPKRALETLDHTSHLTSHRISVVDDFS